MEWALAILVVAAVVLLILSFSVSGKTSKTQQEEYTSYHLTAMKEIKNLQEQIRIMELDMEILAHEAGVKSEEERMLKRDVLDLHRRKYSIETIAKQKSMSVDEVEQLIAPFKKAKTVRGNIADES